MRDPIRDPQETPMNLRCYRDPVRDNRYIVRDAAGIWRGVIIREDPPNNSHISLWYIEGRTGHFSTRRDALEFLERPEYRA